MARFATRLPRLPAPVLLLALAAVLGLSGPRGQRVEAQAQPVDRAAVVESFWAALGQGQLDAAVSTFSEEGVLAGSRSCAPPNSCVGRAAIRNALSALVSVNPSYTITSLSVSGSIVYGQVEVRDTTAAAAGVERTIRSFMAEVPAGRMTALISVNDLSDAQTAQALGLPQSPSIDRQALLEQFFQDRSSGNVDGALSALSDDVFLATAPPCTLALPRVGKDALRPRLQIPSVDSDHRYTALGSAVLVQYEQEGAALASAGIDRIVVAALVQIPQDKITLFVRVPDLTDAQTADNAGMPQAPAN